MPDKTSLDLVSWHRRAIVTTCVIQDCPTCLGMKGLGLRTVHDAEVFEARQYWHRWYFQNFSRTAVDT